MSCTGSACSGRHTNQVPSGPRSSSCSLTCTSRTRYGETSPVATSSTVSSIVVPEPSLAIEYDRAA
jgi:hypothetical protein